MACRRSIGRSSRWCDGGRRRIWAINDFLAANKDDAALAPYLAPVKAALGQVQQATMWLMANGPKNPDNAGAASADYLNLLGLTTLSFMWARIVKAVLARKAAGEVEPALASKLVLARFFNERVLPETAAQLARLTSGAATMMELPAAVRLERRDDCRGGQGWIDRRLPVRLRYRLDAPFRRQSQHMDEQRRAMLASANRPLTSS